MVALGAYKVLGAHFETFSAEFLSFASLEPAKMRPCFIQQFQVQVFQGKGKSMGKKVKEE